MKKPIRPYLTDAEKSQIRDKYFIEKIHPTAIAMILNVTFKSVYDYLESLQQSIIMMPESVTYEDLKKEMPEVCAKLEYELSKGIAVSHTQLPEYYNLKK